MALYWHKGTIIRFKACSHHVNHGYAEDQALPGYVNPLFPAPRPTVQSLPGMQEHTAPDVPPTPTKYNLIADVQPSGTTTDWQVYKYYCKFWTLYKLHKIVLLVWSRIWVLM